MRFHVLLVEYRQAVTAGGLPPVTVTLSSTDAAIAFDMESDDALELGEQLVELTRVRVMRHRAALRAVG